MHFVLKKLALKSWFCCKPPKKGFLAQFFVARNPKFWASLFKSPSLLNMWQSSEEFRCGRHEKCFPAKMAVPRPFWLRQPGMNECSMQIWSTFKIPAPRLSQRDWKSYACKWVGSLVTRLTGHIRRHFGDTSFQAMICSSTDNSLACK